MARPFPSYRMAVMEKNTVAGVILDLLKRAGIEVGFGIPGVHNLAFWNALSSDRPRIINVRHEQSCVYAADGQARSKNKLAVAFTTTGPGAANTLGAFGEAAISGSAVLLISSETPMKNRGSGYRGILHEMVDQSSLFAPLSKKYFENGKSETLARSVTSADEAVLTVNEFISKLSQAPSGVGYVGIPADILNETYLAPIPDALHFEKTLNFSNERFAEVVSGLSNATKVAIWAGGGATEVSTELARLADHLNAPIYTSFAGRGIGIESKRYLTLPIHEPEIAEIMAEAEVLLVFGSQLDGMNTKNWNIPFPEKIYIFDADPEISARNVNTVNVFKTDNLPKIVGQLLNVPPKRAWIDTEKICANTKARLREEERSKVGYSLVSAIESGWPEDGQIVCDMAITGYWTGVYANPKRVRRILYPVGWGTLGFALPASIGSATARKTLVITGDGGIAFGLSELATIKQENLPITILLHDDGGYGMLRFDQKVMRHEERGVDLFNPKWSELASAYSISFQEVNLEDLAGKLKERSQSLEPGILLLRAPIYPPRSTSPRWLES